MRSEEDIKNCTTNGVPNETIIGRLTSEIETLRKAYAMACAEIEDRACSYYRFSNDCKSFCELYDLCAGNIEYEDYFLKKAREENENT